MTVPALSTRALNPKNRVSVLIPVEPQGEAFSCLKALRALPIAERRHILEVLLIRGLQPAGQRNAGIRAARAPWILFLDSDTCMLSGTLPQLLKAASAVEVAGVGGPNLAPGIPRAWGRAMDAVLGSWAGSWTSRARYSAVGSLRRAGEKELILCNLLMRRKLFKALGGFDESLYPNEENELIDRFQAAGYDFCYQPLAPVLRPRRANVWAWVEQAFGYGQGRAKQMRRALKASSLVNLLPLGLPILWFLAWSQGQGLCLLLIMVLAAILLMRFNALAAFLLLARHHAYALGLIKGFLWPSKALKGPITLHRQPWP